MVDMWSTARLCVIALVATALTTATASGGVRTVSSTLHVTADNTDVDHSDPGLAYGVLSWQIEYETCVPLLGYSDVGGENVQSFVAPIGAAGMPVVKNGGKTYVFTVRSGFRFSDGAPLTAANYEYAIDRDASPALLSPVDGFMGSVKGWQNGTAPHGVTGVTASGDTLTIKLTKPDGSLLPKLAMPFFCPIEKAPPFFVSGKWVDSEVTAPYPAAGPYYIASREVGTDIVLKRNPYYSGTRPHEASTILIDMNPSTTEAFDGVSNGTYAADLNGNPEPSQNLQLSKQFGIDKTRFWVHPALITNYLAMNTSRQIFRRARVRRAVNYALDRPALIKIGGYLSGTPTDQILPKALTGGVWSTKLYPITSPGPRRFAKARRLSRDCGLGHIHRLNFWHGASAPAAQGAAVISTTFARWAAR
jgi:peptide/nickel transport system substrate-binding protein